MSRSMSRFVAGRDGVDPAHAILSSLVVLAEWIFRSAIASEKVRPARAAVFGGSIWIYAERSIVLVSGGRCSSGVWWRDAGAMAYTGNVGVVWSYRVSGGQWVEGKRVRTEEAGLCNQARLAEGRCVLGLARVSRPPQVALKFGGPCSSFSWKFQHLDLFICHPRSHCANVCSRLVRHEQW